MSEKSKKMFHELELIFETAPGELKMETTFREDLNAKSMHYFGIMAAIEELTGEYPAYADVKECETIADLMKLFESIGEE